MYLSLVDIAKSLGRSYSCLQNLRQRGRFPVPDLIVGGRCFYKPETAQLIKQLDVKYAKEPYRITSKEEIAKIEEMVNCGIRIVKIAELMGLHYCTVWKHVNNYKMRTGLKKPVVKKDYVSELKFS